MQCVYDERDFPAEFEEKLVFSAQNPYRITIKKFPTEDIIPLHYATTIEILLCEGLSGEIVIDGRRYILYGHQLFVIPPYTLHAGSIAAGAGAMYVLKVSVPDMNPYLSIVSYLALGGVSLPQLCRACPEYDAVMNLVRQLIGHDGDLMHCLTLFLPLFQLLSRHTLREKAASSGSTGFKTASLQELVQWTHANFARKISIEEAAALTGYSKFHFCSRFKALTGVTYLNFLNSVRLSHACLLLSSGRSVQAVCQNCGYENTSYFIQLFRKNMGMTPYQYAAQKKKDPAGEEAAAGARCLLPDEIIIQMHK